MKQFRQKEYAAPGIKKIVTSPFRAVHTTGKIVGETGSYIAKQTPETIKNTSEAVKNGAKKVSETIKKKKKIRAKIKTKPEEVQDRYRSMKKYKTKKAIKGKADEIVEGVKKKGSEIVNTPLNKAVDSGLNALSQSPITSIGSAGGYAAGIAYPPAFAYPTGAVSAGGEVFIKKASPTYKKITEKWGESYKKSGVHSKLRNSNWPSLRELATGQRAYTIQEGHYTGPKDLEKVPGYFEVIGKTTIGGAAAGGVIGGILDKTGVDGASIKEGISTGGKTGFLAGLAAKFLLNSLHKPMKKVKYQEVDKLLRAKFGIYRVSGFTTGDTRERRKSVEEKFSFNDRRVEEYKISFVIRDNQVTMYTLGISDEILEKLNTSLDYYCKKFSGMGYTSKPINTKSNSYSVTITFTNYKAISDFIFEISEETGLKINLLNDDVLLERAEEEESQKEYSMVLSKYDITRILTKASGKALGALVSGPKAAWSALITQSLVEAFKKLRDQEIAKYYPMARKNYGISYLIDRLSELGFIEGVYYTKGVKNCESNMHLDRGVFMITALQGSKAEKLLSDILPEDSKKEVSGKVSLWTWPIESKQKFDIILTKIIKSGVKPNIFL